MADKKISALPASTTPLAGTEVLPIVQSGTTKQVSVANLTAGRAVTASSLTSAAVTASAGYTGGNAYPLISQQATTASNTEGPGLLFKVDPNNIGTFRNAATIRVSQRTANYDNVIFSANANGSLTDVFSISSYLSESSLSPSANNSFSLGRSAVRWSTIFGVDANLTGNVVIATAGKGLDFGSSVLWRTGAGSPEGVVTAAVGSLYTRTDGGLLTTLYVKESGAGNTGWVGK
jgi:hypothetical protein